MINVVNNLNELDNFTKKIVEQCKKNTYLLLKGDLGAGKTTFTKFLLKNLGVKENVTSPTFNILNQYKVGNLNINHMDAYRLNNDSEIEMFAEQFQDSLNIIEWYNNLDINYSNLNSIKITIKVLSDEKREFEVIY